MLVSLRKHRAAGHEIRGGFRFCPNKTSFLSKINGSRYGKLSRPKIIGGSHDIFGGFEA